MCEGTGVEVADGLIAQLPARREIMFSDAHQETGFCVRVDHGGEMVIPFFSTPLLKGSSYANCAKTLRLRSSMCAATLCSASFMEFG